MCRTGTMSNAVCRTIWRIGMGHAKYSTQSPSLLDACHDRMLTPRWCVHQASSWPSNPGYSFRVAYRVTSCIARIQCHSKTASKSLPVVNVPFHHGRGWWIVRRRDVLVELQRFRRSCSHDRMRSSAFISKSHGYRTSGGSSRYLDRCHSELLFHIGCSLDASPRSG